MGCNHKGFLTFERSNLFPSSFHRRAVHCSNCARFIRWSDTKTPSTLQIEKSKKIDATHYPYLNSPESTLLDMILINIPVDEIGNETRKSVAEACRRLWPQLYVYTGGHHVSVIHKEHERRLLFITGHSADFV